MKGLLVKINIYSNDIFFDQKSHAPSQQGNKLHSNST